MFMVGGKLKITKICQPLVIVESESKHFDNFFRDRYKDLTSESTSKYYFQLYMSCMSCVEFRGA